MERFSRLRASELILAGILILAAVTRFVGIGWDRNTHLHPDERFLTTVETSLQFPGSIAAYFDTANSTFNPHNTGHGFFVYGTLPIFLVRYLGEWAGQIDAIVERLGEFGYDQVHIVGRAASASFDVVSVLLVYLIGARLYSRRVGLLAAVFTTFSALLIQHAHFFVVDSFANTFILAAIYFAVLAMDEGRSRHFVYFGLMLGMAAASKISAAPLAGVLALAVIVRLRSGGVEEGGERYEIGRLVLAAAVSLITFRILQPYAFKSFSLALNPLWLENLRSVQVQTSGAADFPPATQWADRIRVWFSFKNLVVYGMGWPLGLLAWAGWGWALARMLKGESQRHLIPVVWTGAYFLWRGAGFTMAMRYQLPVYPTLALLAAWALWEAWERVGTMRLRGRLQARWLVAALGGFVLLATVVYGSAFALNYARPFTRYEASAWIYRHLPGPINLVLEAEGEQLLEPVPVGREFQLVQGNSYDTTLVSHSTGRLRSLLLPYAGDLSPGNSKSLQASLYQGDTLLATAELQSTLDPEQENRLELAFDTAVELQADLNYRLLLDMQSGGTIALRGAILIAETSWDDALPARIEGRDGFAQLYTGVNQELYWNDDEDKNENGESDKLERIVSTLQQGDYLVITSSRQYGSVGRLEQRYPLTISYYRQLFGCPTGVEIEVCAADAQTQSAPGPLGYQLIATFERNPKLGPFAFRDQLSEESFTVYDHPKVLIFAKTEAFDPQALRRQLAAVDVSNVINAAPKDMGSAPPDLLLPENRVASQRSGGTWSQIFPPDGILNRSQPLAVIAWWMLLAVLSLAAFPLVRAAFPGLRTGGYPLARLVAMLFTAWASWMAGSLGLPYGRGTILLAILLMALISLALVWRKWDELPQFFRDHRREILWVETLALSFFLFDLLIRLGNPDLWHRWLGGEKPMDLSYLNAVIKSTSFPPYDPWYAGGYINYYYFGFVLVGTPIRLIGIEPAIAYNLVLPTLFSVAALGAYTVGSNLVARMGEAYQSLRRVSPRVAGFAAALALVVLGNLGTVRLIYESLQEIGARGSEGSAPALIEAISGFGKVITLQETLPIGLHNWYWDPSRAIPAPEGEVAPITEFPFFTFLYADLHAHMISLPLTVLAIAWALSWVLAPEKGLRSSLPIRGVGLAIGALALGALGPTNTWDFPVYWTLGALAAAAAPILRERKLSLTALGETVVSAGLLLGLAYLLYRPYHQWYGVGYTDAEPWSGSRTSLGGYLTVHGLYLVVLLPWLAWETRQWMAATPLSALSRFKPYAVMLLTLVLVGIFGVAYVTVDGLSITPLVALMLLWTGLLLLRRDQPIEKRVVLVMVGTAAALTFLVEVVRLAGDIGRMNTVFKFYLQVWTLFSLSAGAALVWTLADLPAWSGPARASWSIVMAAATFGALLYPLTAVSAKIRDRISDSTPVTLDGMAYMTTATYDDLGQSFSLESDYHAIEWIQRNIEGSPVIVEAQIPEYRWGSRYSIYTGLPAVLGWNWHQRQQRAAVENLDVSQRAQAISSFYLTGSPDEALGFIRRYDVRYVIVGELERLYYGKFDKCTPIDGGDRVNCDLSGRLTGQWILDIPASRCEDNGGSLICPTGGLEKFESMESLGMLREVYRNGGTVIYEVRA